MLGVEAINWRNERTSQELDEVAPKLDELSLATAIDACKRAGAVNAAGALSKHVTRMQIENEQLMAENHELRGRIMLCGGCCSVEPR